MPLTEEDLKTLPLPTAHEISVDSFADAAEIDVLLTKLGVTFEEMDTF